MRISHELRQLRTARWIVVALVVFALHVAVPASGAPAPAAEPPCEFEGVGRIVAIGDVHGAYDRFVEILRVAGVVDRRGRWSGGTTHLVQLGDVVDRGPDSRKALDLIRRLEREAAAAGGRVHALLGNHEVMRMSNDFRYTTPGEYAAFATRDSEELRRLVVEAAAPDVRDRLRAETPLGMIEMIQAFGPAGSYGAFLRKLNAVVRINGALFLHGGLSPAVSPLRCAEINASVRKDLAADLVRTPPPETSLASRPDGPLWDRGLAEETESFAPHVDEILAAQQARTVIVGHTVRPDGRIDVRFGGKVIVIDTGMQPAYAPAGQPSALEIRGSVFTAIYRDRREVIVGPAGADGK